jgi:hypothetical protein
MEIEFSDDRDVHIYRIKFGSLKIYCLLALLGSVRVVYSSRLYIQ